MNDPLTGVTLIPMLLGGLFGTLVALGFPVFLAIAITKENWRASLSATFIWTAIIVGGVWGGTRGTVFGEGQHLFNASLAYVLVTSLIAVPVIALVLSWTIFRPAPEEDTMEMETHVFGVPEVEDRPLSQERHPRT
ncbi:MAG: hypothetical protein AAGH60_14460 [Pseudomonadota bacterium]